MQRKRWCAASGRALSWIAVSWMLAMGAQAQGVSTTTVQGTVYLANGQPGSGTLVVKWPAFTTAAGQAIVAGSTTMSIAADGYVSLNLAPNQGATPAGEYYTAIFDLSDGSSNTEYWVIPAAAQATLAQVRAQVMPAAQAVQAASKAYVDQSIAELSGSLLTASGGDLTGPLYLNGDPGQPLQAATKHYVDSQVAEAVPLTGGTLTGPLTATRLGAAWQVDQFPGADFGARLQACVDTLDPVYGGTCDARNFAGPQSMSANLMIDTGDTTVLLPCATISTASQIVVPAGVRNVALRGCALRGGSASSGSTGGTAFAYTGAAAMVQVGDPTYAADTSGFRMDNLVINTTGASNATARALAAYRTQELDLDSLYLLGNANQTGMTLDGTGNYTGGTFLDDQISGFQTAVHAIGHQVANSATTDWLNASTFVRLHVDCPTSSGSPMAGTIGVDLQQGDGNTFTGGDVEGCATALHLGANAQNNTIVGLRNENSNQQVVADAGSAYNSWITGGTMYTGQLTDNGTRNSFMDTFHRSFNELNGDWYGSQQDATVTNHFRLGIGTGNERGLLNRYQTDSGYRWTTGLSDATAGEQFYQIQDELNHVNRISIGQYNSGQSSTNNQTAINSAGTGAVVLNGSNGSGTGGVIFGSGGPSETTVATVDQAGNAQFNGALQVGGTSQSSGTMTVRNNADAEVDYYLWPGLTTSQKGSFTYKDWNGASQWYMVKDQNNNWALNSALGGLDSFKAYQSTNSGDTYINASNPSGAVRVNYETGSGGGFKIYGGNSSTLYASFTGAAAIALPGLAASSGHNCLQIDSSGYITNTGAACVTSSGGSTSVGASTPGYVAYYTGSGASIGGESSVPLAAGGTGATTAAGALANLGGLPIAGGTLTGGLNGTSATFSDTLAAGTKVSALSVVSKTSPWIDVTAYGADPTGVASSTAAIQSALNAASDGSRVYFPAGKYSLTYTSGSCILNITHSIEMFGSKIGSILSVAGGIPSTVPVVCTTPASNAFGIHYHDVIFQSAGPSATAGDVFDFYPSPSGYGPAQAEVDHITAPSNDFGGMFINTMGVETISSCTESGTTVTCTTTTPPPYAANVTHPSVKGNSVSGYNLAGFLVTAVTPNSFSFTAASGLGTGTGGTVYAGSIFSFGGSIHDNAQIGETYLNSSVADSVGYYRNWASSDTQPCIDVNINPGSAQTVIRDNNFTCLGGAVVVQQAQQIKIMRNQMEQCGRALPCGTASTEPNGAMVDLQGPVTQATIQGNNLNTYGSGGAGAPTAIRVDNASRVTINDSNTISSAINGILTTSLSSSVCADNNSIGATNVYAGTANVSSCTATQAQYLGVIAEKFSTTMSNGILIQTAIPFANTSYNYGVHVYGYNYGAGLTFNLQIGFHIYSGAFYKYSMSSSGGYLPTVQLSNVGGYVAIFLSMAGVIQPSVFADAYETADTSATPGWYQNWSVTDSALSGSGTVTLSPSNTLGSTTFTAGLGVTGSDPLFFSTSPNIQSGFGTSPSLTNPNGTAFFDVIVGSSPSTTGTLGLPAVPHTWGCFCENITSPALRCLNTSSTTTAATLTSYSAGTATAFNASDDLRVWCAAR